MSENNIITKTLTIGTRGSKLALWQANFAKAELKKIGIEANLQIIKTKGDKIQHLSFDKIEGKGFFTKELEEALLIGDIDFAVHSMKDLPTESPEGLVISAVSNRANPADWLLINKDKVDENETLKLPQKAIVGTSSARRKSQLSHFRNDLEIKDIRGNVPTRIRKLEEDGFDAIVLAAAGVSRLELDLSNFEVIELDPREFVPAPAQGVLAYQACKSAVEVRRILKHLHHPEVSQATNVERKVMKLIGGGCHIPLGVYCKKDHGNNYHVWANYASDVDQPMRITRRSSSTFHNLAELIVEDLKADV